MRVWKSRNEWALALLAFAGALFATIPLRAQWVKSVTLGTSYDDNAFRIYDAKTDYVTHVAGYFARNFPGQRWQGRLYYEGQFNIFAHFSDRNFLYQKAGLALAHSLSKKKTFIFLGLNGQHRLNRATYNYYDLNEISAYVNLKHYLASGTILQFGYRARRRAYAQISSFSYFENFLFARITYSLPTHTTVVFESHYGQKHYLQGISNPGAVHTGFYDHDYGHQPGGMGHMRDSRWNPGGTTSVVSQPGVSQWAGSLRLAQSISPNTGVHLEGLLRRNLRDAVRYLAGQVAGYANEDELFDDPYGYESEEAEIGLTQLLPWQMTVEMTANVQWKDYVNRPALDLAGNPLPSSALRKDRLAYARLTFSKSIALRNEMQSLEIFGQLSFFDNQSNDAFYNYTRRLFVMGFYYRF